MAGLLLSVFAVRETRGHARHEAVLAGRARDPGRRSVLPRDLWLTSWRDKRLFAASQAGLVNNLNDGLAWGLFPLFFAAGGLDLDEIAILAAVYLGVWGLAQLGTGAWSDRVGRKWLIAAGMWVQAGGHLPGRPDRRLRALAARGGPAGARDGDGLPDPAGGHRGRRAPRVAGLVRRRLPALAGMGYAVGALLAGAVADLLGLRWAIGVVGALTLASGVVVSIGHDGDARGEAGHGDRAGPRPGSSPENRMTG